jgi:hypothetical protein
MGEGVSRRRGRPGDGRRRALLVLSIATLLCSLVVSVRRGARGNQLAGDLSELSRTEELLRAQLEEEEARVDSLSSRGRIEAVAARLGLHQAEDSRIIHLPEIAPGAGAEKAGR